MTHVLFFGPLTQRSQRGPPDLKKPLFQIIPDKFVLQPYQSQVITLQGCSPMYVKQSACSQQVFIPLPSPLSPPSSLPSPPSSLPSPPSSLPSPPSSLPSPPFSPQVVNERLLCHAIIGRNPHKERIMVVDVSARFIAPLLEFSTQEMRFTIQQVRPIIRKAVLS